MEGKQLRKYIVTIHVAFNPLAYLIPLSVYPSCQRTLEQLKVLRLKTLPLIQYHSI